jgi:hypothetical protein
MKIASLIGCALSLVLIAGCAGPRERAEELTVPTNPLARARPGDMCRYRAVREDSRGEAVSESWTLQVNGKANGLARVDVSVLGPALTPHGPSPREPGYVVRLPTAEGRLSSPEIMRLFHRPELTSEGMLAVLDRDVKHVEGTMRSFTMVVLDHTREAHELTVTFDDDSLVRGTYRVVVVDDLPVLGIAQAELDEEWTTVEEDGARKTSRRHETLDLVEASGAADSK